MSGKAQLRKQRADTVINTKSKKQEKDLSAAVTRVIEHVQGKFPGVKMDHATQWTNKTIVERLKKNFPNADFEHHHPASFIKPDGGILSLKAKDGTLYPILIAEKKNQGTNDIRKEEGKKKQPQGNAIERMGKNVIALRAVMLKESIFPFVAFCDGCDFADGSSIVDRVVSIAMYGKLNKIHLHNEHGVFNRGSFFVRHAAWSEDEMYATCVQIAMGSIEYYFETYGKERFLAA